MSEKNNQILLDVSSKIDQWLKASENRSLNLLARRSGQPYMSQYDSSLHESIRQIVVMR